MIQGFVSTVTAMPSVDIETIRRLARLARIELDEAGLLEQQGHTERLLKLVDTIGAVDTQGIEPMVHPLDLGLPLRRDHADCPDRSAELLELAPEAGEGHYRVPRVVE